MRVYFDTFGCRLNKAEALQQEAEYLAKGWSLAKSHAEADLIIVRGCSVTSRAQRECEHLIEHLKRHYPTAQIRTEGCLRKSDKNILIRNLAKKIKAEQTPVDPAIIPTRTARAYLKVQDGCNGKCSFCIVPKFRGESVSTPFDDLLDRSKRFIDAGYHEIVVTGCNLSLYASAGKRLPELLDALAKLSSDCRIRLGSLEPGACANDTISVMAENANICRFLHLSVQSGSNRILVAMRRNYSVNDVDRLVETAIKQMPDIGIGCDIITGFPAESEMDFTATKGLLNRLPFSNAHIFPFSERPGTIAATMNGTIAKNVRSARAHELSHIIKDKRYAFAQKFLGKTVDVVIESEKDYSGWTSQYLLCAVIGVAKRKSLVKAFINKVHHDGSMSGRLVK